MADPTTANKILAQPTRGSDTGTWDTPMNSNTGIIDASFGGITSLALTNAGVALSTAQAQNVFIKLTGAITANITLTFPGGIGSYYTIINQTTNSSAFVVTMTTSATGATTIGLPPGAQTKVLIDGTNPQYEALPHHVGEYWLHAGSSTPLWVTSCTNPPYLNCDGTTFSSATYPALNSLLGSTTLPDARGRALFALDQGTGRNGIGAAYTSTGAASITLAQANLPAHNHPVSDPGHTHTAAGNGNFILFGGTGTGANITLGGGNANQNNNTASNTTGLTVSNSTYANSAFSNLPPALAHGITMVRAG